MNWDLPYALIKDVIRINGERGTFPEINYDTPVTFLYGTAGSGKTSLAINTSLGGDGWSFVNCVQMIDRMVGCKNCDEVKKMERRAQEDPRLIIDEAGLEGNVRFSKFADFTSLDIIRRILMARLVLDRRTIITTNLAPELLFAKYDKVTDASGRIYSRFANHARLYFMEGDRRQKKEGQVFKCTEKTWFDEYAALKDDDPIFKGEPRFKKKVPLGPRVKATITLYDESEKELYKRDDTPNTEKQIRESVKAVRDKPELEDRYFKWLETTKYKTLIPKEWHGQARARKKAEATKGKQRDRQADALTTGHSADGGDVHSGIQHRAGGAAEARRGSGGDAGGAEVDTSDVPW